eukprot:10795906-Alexandrium_andersonii.AAC.1
MVADVFEDGQQASTGSILGDQSGSSSWPHKEHANTHKRAHTHTFSISACSLMQTIACSCTFPS